MCTATNVTQLPTAGDLGALHFAEALGLVYPTVCAVMKVVRVRSLTLCNLPEGGWVGGRHFVKSDRSKGPPRQVLLLDCLHVYISGLVPFGASRMYIKIRTGADTLRFARDSCAREVS